MEKLAQIVTLTAAGCFVGTAAILFGQAWGLQHEELIWLWTFGDVVNAAAPAVLKYGAVVVIYAYCQFRAREIQVTWQRGLANLLLLLPVWAVAFFVKTPTTLNFTITAFSILNLSVMFQNQITNFLGQQTWQWLDTGLAAVFACLLLGFLNGTNSLMDSQGVQISTEKGKVCANAGVGLERGLVMISGANYSLVPWSTIISTENRKKIQKPGEPSVKDDSCFGWGPDDQPRKP